MNNHPVRLRVNCPVCNESEKKDEVDDVNSTFQNKVRSLPKQFQSMWIFFWHMQTFYFCLTAKYRFSSFPLNCWAKALFNSNERLKYKIPWSIICIANIFSDSNQKVHLLLHITDKVSKNVKLKSYLLWKLPYFTANTIHFTQKSH